MPKGFTEKEKELIAARLLEQGDRLFSAYGLKKTNVEEIAQAAGISKGAFYLFYDSKEALFMDVVEQAEVRLRRELLAAIALPGPSPRERLYGVFKKAFNLFESIPVLHFFNQVDFDLLFRRLPAEKFQQHLGSDLAFIHELIAACREAGIEILVPPEKITGLLYPIVLAVLHAEAGLPGNFSGDIDLLLKLVAAYALGEVRE
jgi:AcrR family transcriptional regulator